MAHGKEIRKQIASIKNTQKITRAMEMVAASKMRRAQARMQAARPYAQKIRQVIGHLHYAHPEYRHPFLEARAPRRAGFIVVTSDRGLCGGLNAGVLRTTLSALQEWQAQAVEVELCTIGAKGFQALRRLGGAILAQVTQLGDTPRLEPLIGAVKVMLDAYTAGRLDRVYLVYNQFLSTMAQHPVVEALLPLPPSGEPELAHHWDYLYEPDAREAIDELLRRYIESQVYHGVVENFAAEQSARMVAMRSASDNAGKLIEELTLKYNKARQAAITQEIAEIVGGAAAV